MPSKIIEDQGIPNVLKNYKNKTGWDDFSFLEVPDDNLSNTHKFKSSKYPDSKLNDTYNKTKSWLNDSLKHKNPSSLVLNLEEKRMIMNSSNQS